MLEYWLGYDIVDRKALVTIRKLVGVELPDAIDIVSSNAALTPVAVICHYRRWVSGTQSC